VLPGLSWRRGLNLAVLAVALVTTTAAALGPLYARASTESTLNDHLTEAGAAIGLHLSADVDTTNSHDIDQLRAEAGGGAPCSATTPSSTASTRRTRSVWRCPRMGGDS
jgi:hypothetical protein